MQTVVIIVLLLAGVLCIGAQIAITYLNSRPEKPEAAVLVEPPLAPTRASAAKTPGATTTTARTTAAKTAAAKAAAVKAEADAAKATAAEAAAQEAAAESTKDRLMRHTTAALGSKTAAGAKLGVLGLVLMLIAVALVIDITASFTIAT